MNNDWRSPTHRLTLEDVDSQHDHILRLAEGLIEGYPTCEPQTFELVVHHLIRFVEWHFATEEALMKDGDYPMLEQHSREHEFFLQQLSEFSAAHTRTRLGDGKELAGFLCEWFDRHTFRSDRLFQQYLLEQQPA